MSGKSVPFSVRLSQEDAAFIAGLNVTDALTPSDKIRLIISEARRKTESTEDFNQALHTAQDDMRPIMDRLRTYERQHGTPSEILHLTAQWLNELQAEFISGTASLNDAHAAKAFEARIANHIAKLTEQILRLAITHEAQCLDPAIAKTTALRIVELADIIQSQHSSRELPQKHKENPNA